ncbi:methionyl-tRNA formyltransferase [bacterium]|nr:methionyl-tRNA formyltransferase [bacterium]
MPYRVVFMGTPEFSLPSLSLLAASRDFSVELVITQPDRPRDRGMKLHPPPVKVLADELHLPVCQVETLDAPELWERLRQLAPDFLVVVAFGMKIPNAMLAVPRLGSVNLHPSLLPKYRGAAPIQWALINGESVTGVSTQFVAEAWDSGDLIDQEPAVIEPQDNYATLSTKLAEQGAHLLLKSLSDVGAGRARPRPQEAGQATPARRISKELGRIDWNQPALRIHNLVHGLTPKPGAYSFLSGKRVKLIATSPHPKRQTPGVPGEVVSLRFSDRVIVKTGKGDLVIETLQREGGAVMSARDFINGYRVRVGDRFTDQAKP